MIKRIAWGLVALVVFSSGVVGETPNSKADNVLTVEVTRDIPYTIPLQPNVLTWQLDVYAPTTPGNWPAVVILPGAGASKEGLPYQELARIVAGQGAVVFLANHWPREGFPNPLPLFQNEGAGLRQAFDNSACVVRFARAMVSEYGGNSERVIMFGHSAGGYNGMWIALVGDAVERVWDEFTSEQGAPPKQVDCVIGDVSAELDSFIGFAGAYVYNNNAWAAVKDENPELDQVASLNSYIGDHPDLPIRFIHGESDPIVPAQENEPFFKDLLEAGYDITWTRVGGSHFLIEDGPAWGSIIVMILEAVGR